MRSVNRETEAMLGNASPRNPSVAIAARSVAVAILLVACRSRHSRASSGGMPLPSSSTRMRRLPPYSTVMVTRVARGVDGVLDQLLDHRRRPLDDFPGGDLVGQVVGQLADARHGYHHPDRRNHTNMVTAAPAMSATTHQNCAASPPGRCGSGTFMP